MNCKDLKFMAIGANCACLGFLGDNRIRGPVDNLWGNCNVICFKSLFEGSIVNEIIDNPPLKIVDRKPGFRLDSNKAYVYKSYQVVHNDPTTEKFKQEFLKRYDNFKEFYNHIQEPDYYFTYSLNVNELDRANHLIKSISLIENINYLKQLNIFHKTIFVGTRLEKIKNYWNFYATDVQKYIDEYNLLYVEIIDNVLHDPKSHEQFLKKVSTIIAP